jgi:D-alanine transaminase
MLVYLNGRYIESAEATISVDDRGFLFADGLYEVIRVYGGKLFLAEPHLQRLRRGLAAVRMNADAADPLLTIAEKLIAENHLTDADATIYIQITRGAAPRRHSFPEPAPPPTVYVATKPFPRPTADTFAAGVATVSVPDTRWGRCDIKSVGLLPNVLANQHAKVAGAYEAIFVRDGVLIEGSHSNLMGFVNNEVVTYPECNYILGGITRRLVLDLARDLGLAVREGPIFADRMDEIDELFLSGTTTEVMPITRLDGRPIGDGRPGEVAQRLQHAFADFALGASARR